MWFIEFSSLNKVAITYLFVDIVVIIVCVWQQVERIQSDLFFVKGTKIELIITGQEMKYYPLHYPVELIYEVL